MDTHDEVGGGITGEYLEKWGGGEGRVETSLGGERERERETEKQKQKSLDIFRVCGRLKHFPFLPC